MNLVTWQDASAYCRSLEGTLPRLVEWELAMRLKGGPRIEEKTHEWIADPFPASELQRGPPQQCEGADCYMVHYGQPDGGAKPSGPRLSWNRSPGTKALPDVGFRCAFRR
jgi:hypothetical protein